MPETRASQTLVWLLCLSLKDALEALMGNITSPTKINKEVSLLEMLIKVLQRQEVNCKELATMLDTLKLNIVDLSDKLAENIYLYKSICFLMLNMKKLNSHYRISFEVNDVTKCFNLFLL